MAILWVRNKYGAEEWSREGNNRDRATIRLLVWSDTPDDTGATILADRRFPKINQRWQLGNKSSPVRVRAVKSLSRDSRVQQLWEASIEYDTPPEITWQPGEAPPGQIALPPPKWSGSSQRREYVAHVDLDGKPIRNTVGQRFRNPPPTAYYTRLYEITWLVWHWDDNVAVGRGGLINRTNDGFLHLRAIDQQINKAELFCHDIAFRENDYQGRPAVQLTAVLEYDWTFGFRPTQIANEGTLQREADENGNLSPGDLANAPIVPTHDANGVRHGKPILLTREGTPLPADADPFMLDFNLIAETNFNFFAHL